MALPYNMYIDFNLQGIIMIHIKRAVSLVLTVLMIALLAGCGKGYKKEYLYFELSEQPIVLDAQTAKSDSELLIVRNIYEGLLRRDFYGNIVCGAAESYTKDALTYTFKLRQGAFWEHGQEVTADDFLFGFQRAVDPKTNAPFAKRLFAIKNAQAIFEGSAPIDSLGVEVIDNYTLTITLEREDPAFEQTLTESVSMPCNRKFFKGTIGQYGLVRDCVNSNGSYSLRKWNQEDFGVRLYKNEGYNGNFEAENAAVFISCDDTLTQTERLIENESDMAFLPSVEYETAFGNGLRIESVQNICWYLTLGDEYSSEVKSAFLSAFSQSLYEKSLPQGFEVANSIYPPFLSAQENFAFADYDIALAQSLISSAVQKTEQKVFADSVLLYAPSDAARAVATDIVAHWQKNLSTFINIKAADSVSELAGQLENKSLAFALFPIKANAADNSEYLAQFGAEYSGLSPEAAQNKMIENKNILPIAYENTNIAFNSTLENVKMFDTNGYIDFSFIIKRK